MLHPYPLTSHKSLVGIVFSESDLYTVHRYVGINKCNDHAWQDKQDQGEIPFQLLPECFVVVDLYRVLFLQFTSPPCSVYFGKFFTAEKFPGVFSQKVYFLRHF